MNHVFEIAQFYCTKNSNGYVNEPFPNCFQLLTCFVRANFLYDSMIRQHLVILESIWAISLTITSFSCWTDGTPHDSSNLLSFLLFLYVTLFLDKYSTFNFSFSFWTNFSKSNSHSLRALSDKLQVQISVSRKFTKTFQFPPLVPISLQFLKKIQDISNSWLSRQFTSIP